MVWGCISAYGSELAHCEKHNQFYNLHTGFRELTYQSDAKPHGASNLLQQYDFIVEELG